MKKILSLLFALVALTSVNAATVEWKAAKMPAHNANNDSLDNVTIDINAYLSMTFANGDATANNYIRYRKIQALPEPVIAFYSGNTITLNAKNAVITSVQIVPITEATNAGNDNTPGWKLKAGESTLSAESGVDTWTGSVSELLLVGGSKTSIARLNIEYDITEEIPEPDPSDFQTARLFFGEDDVAEKGSEKAMHVVLAENGTSVEFITTSTSAVLEKDKTGYFGDAENYETYTYRYQPAGRSTNGINSSNKGIFTFPCAGTLYMYCYNTSTDEPRELQIVQNNDTIFKKVFNASDYVTPENTTRKVYPIYQTEVKAGTAYFLWVTNQLAIYGFVFEPGVAQDEPQIENLYLHFTDEEGNYIRTLEETGEKTEDGFSFSFELLDTKEGYSYFVFTDDIPEVSVVALTTDWSVYGNLYHADADNPNSMVKYDGESEITPFAAKNGASYNMNVSPSGDMSFEISTGVEEIMTSVADGKMYNVFGQPVDASYKGIVIMNGKKFINR